MSKILKTMDYSMCLETIAKGESPRVVVMGRTCDLPENLMYVITASEVIAMMYNLPAGEWMYILNEGIISPFRFVAFKDTFT